jgi:hypothetical protein
VQLSKVNDWLGLTTNVGVILGLILVAYELQQTQVAISTEVYATGREGWSNWTALIIENSEVADIWLRGNAGEELSSVDQERYAQLVRERLWIQIQMFDQWTRVDGEPADWVIAQLIRNFEAGPGLREQIEKELDDVSETAFARRFKLLHPNFF